MDNIVSREEIRRRARDAFARGAGREDHNMNWFAPAVVDWQAEWDRCAAAETAVLLVKPMLAQAGANPP
jgi:hypothetical protein